MMQLRHGPMLAAKGFPGVVVLEHDRANVGRLHPFLPAVLARKCAALSHLDRPKCSLPCCFNEPAVANHEGLKTYRLRRREGDIEAGALLRFSPERLKP